MYSVKMQVAVFTVVIATNWRLVKTGEGDELTNEEAKVEEKGEDAHDTKPTRLIKVLSYDTANNWVEMTEHDYEYYAQLSPTPASGSITIEETMNVSDAVAGKDVETSRKRDKPDSKTASPETVDKSEPAEKQSTEIVKKRKENETKEDDSKNEKVDISDDSDDSDYEEETKDMTIENAEKDENDSSKPKEQTEATKTTEKPKEQTEAKETTENI